MTKLLLRLPWFLSAPLIVALAIGMAWGGNWLLSDYFERIRLDEASPLAVEASGGETAPSDPGNGASGGRVAAEGLFQDGDSSHRGEGAAMIIETAEGELVLRFEEFSVTNGPDLFVVLSEGTDGDGASNGLNLGENRATDGNVNYEIPAGTDLSRYKSVIIWCRAFDIVFAYANLEAS
jgi:hypothetical protein